MYRKLRRTSNSVKKRAGNLEGSSNVPGARLSIPPGFLAGGCRSKLARKNKDRRRFEDHILKGNLEGLLYEEEEPETPTRAPQYYLDLMQNKPKSIFKEIQRRYKIVETTKVNKNFNQDFFKETNLDLTVTCLENLSLKIYYENRSVNRILMGKEEPIEEMANLGKESSQSKNIEGEFTFVPPEEWVYKTPPRAKIVTTKIEESQIQPALLCTTKKQQKIYELNEKLNVNFTNFTSRQELNIDTMFLKHVASFNNTDDDQTFNPQQFMGLKVNKNDYQEIGEPLTTEGDTCKQINDYFMALTCRPKKAITKKSRIGKMRRKNIFSEEKTIDYTVVCEEDGDLNFVPTQEPKRFKLNFNSTPPNCDFQMFPVDDSPKMFDFSNMQQD